MPPAPASPPPTAAPQTPTGSANAASPSPSLADFDSKFADMDDAPEPTPEPAPAPTPEPATEPTPTIEPKTDSRPKDPTTGKFVPKTEPKVDPKTEPKSEPKTDEFTPPQVATGSQLRKFAEQAGSRARQAMSEVAQLRSEVQKLKTTPHEDSSALTQQLAQANQKIQQYETDARLTRYERSDEYRTKFEQPYQTAVKQAYGDVKELLVSIPKPTDEDPNAVQEREATPADFDEIYNLPLGPASRLAKQKFGDQAGIVLQHRNAIKNAAKAALEAVESNKGNATKYEQEQTTAQKMRQEAQNQMFSTVIEDLQTKYPDWFGEREGDKEWNEARAKGISIADMAFDAEERCKLTPQQNAVLDAQIHMRSAAFAPMKMELTKLRTENKKLTEELTQIRGSAPGKPGVSATGAASGKSKGALAGFDEAFGAD